MPVLLTLHPERKLALFRMIGTLTIEDCTEGFVTYVDHPQFDPRLVMLTDTRNLDHLEADFRGILWAVGRSRRLFGRFPGDTLSVIHAPRDVHFGLARILQQVTEPIGPFRFEIERDEHAALAHAGQAEAGFDALEAALAVEARRP